MTEPGLCMVGHKMDQYQPPVSEFEVTIQNPEQTKLKWKAKWNYRNGSMNYPAAPADHNYYGFDVRCYPQGSGESIGFLAGGIIRTTSAEPNPAVIKCQVHPFKRVMEAGNTVDITFELYCKTGKCNQRNSDGLIDTKTFTIKIENTCTLNPNLKLSTEPSTACWQRDKKEDQLVKDFVVTLDGLIPASEGKLKGEVIRTEGAINDPNSAGAVSTSANALLAVDGFDLECRSGSDKMSLSARNFSDGLSIAPDGQSTSKTFQCSFSPGAKWREQYSYRAKFKIEAFECGTNCPSTDFSFKVQDICSCESPMIVTKSDCNKQFCGCPNGTYPIGGKCPLEAGPSNGRVETHMMGSFQLDSFGQFSPTNIKLDLSICVGGGQIAGGTAPNLNDLKNYIENTWLPNSLKVLNDGYQAPPGGQDITFELGTVEYRMPSKTKKESVPYWGTKPENKCWQTLPDGSKKEIACVRVWEVWESCAAPSNTDLSPINIANAYVPTYENCPRITLGPQDPYHPANLFRSCRSRSTDWFSQGKTEEYLKRMGAHEWGHGLSLIDDYGPEDGGARPAYSPCGGDGKNLMANHTQSITWIPSRLSFVLWNRDGKASTNTCSVSCSKCDSLMTEIEKKTWKSAPMCNACSQGVCVPYPR